MGKCDNDGLFGNYCILLPGIWFIYLTKYLNYRRIMGNEIQCQGLLSLFNQVLYVFAYTRPRYKVSVSRTIGPLVYSFSLLSQLKPTSQVMQGKIILHKRF